LVQEHKYSRKTRRFFFSSSWSSYSCCISYVA